MRAKNGNKRQQWSDMSEGSSRESKVRLGSVPGYETPYSRPVDEALFSILAKRIGDAVFLIYLQVMVASVLEALSRGQPGRYLVDAKPACTHMIKKTWHERGWAMPKS